ncbi:hypothetical protein Pla108_25680 [Botrimarina colliarenosi]|uniref:Aerotolerance regulator N-terminal domain-containing protein n=1 Tax=Botrimarina colliarenosi TaxID=2528001 RepID=A0A5C6A9V9_9BACT|nr:BatA domain-containing protein [Botrimarina colliarenosi]TWT96794.1 hypothetical protein Pla108_25680 [Botrimarina colliarenosi]
MAFLSPLLLAGVALIAIPIVLHLRKRRDPIRVQFPALRLLKRNRHKTETQLRLRRWVLLALRCLLLAMLAAALARPLLKPPSADGAAGDTGPAGAGVGLALVIDNGPNAAYQSRNASRLEVAQQMAGDLLASLPGETPVVLADRSTGGGAASLEPAAAAARVDRLRVTPAAKPLAIALRDAVTRLAETPAARREAYVFTDLSAGAWDEAAQGAVAAVLDAHPGVALRLVDIGVAEPRNAAIDGLRLPSESLAVGEPLTLVASLHLVGEWREPLAVQLWLDGEQGPVKRDERLVEPDAAGTIDFTLAGLPEGFATGFVRVIAGDAAPDDDVRYFAVEVRRPRSMLIVAPTEADAVFFRAAIDPSVADPGVTRRFETEVIAIDAWARQSLAGFDAVALIDPAPMIERGRGWRRLYDLAVGGGGVGVFLGREATLDAFNTPDAQTLLPAELVWRSREETYLRPTSFSHPAIKPLAPYADAILWQTFPVFQRWELGDLREGAAVVARYADGGPAIVEQAVGRGRVVVMTTSVSDRLDRPDPWNRLPTGDDPWPFVVLARSLADYLTGAADAQLSYTAGDTVAAPLPTGLETPGYVLRTPGGESIRQSIPPGRGELSIPAATEPGPYRIEAGAELDRRFVVNLDPSAGHVERVAFSDLQSTLGKDRVRLLKDEEALANSIDLGRVGRELYGWVLALAAAALVGEHWVGARYYRQSKEDR